MIRVRSLTVVGVLAIAACAEPVLQPTELRSVQRSSSTVEEGTDTYLVRFKGNGVPADFAANVAALGGEVIFAHEVGIAAVAGIGASGAATLAANDGVAAVDEDAYTVQDDVMMDVDLSEGVESPTNPAGATSFWRQWNMRAISAPQAWAAGKLGSPSVKVGILDTGIDYLHPDLVGRVDLGLSRSFLSPAENARVQAAYPGAHPIADLNYHGTHVAATVASNAYALAGVTANVTLVGLKVCSPGTAANGFRGSCPTSGTLNAILYAADQGLDVINLSLGGSFRRVQASASGGFGPSFLATINQVFNYANRKGTAIVVSAGNSAFDMDHDGNGYKSYCSTAAVICVSATGPTFAQTVGTTLVNVQNIDALAGYSNYGRSSIDVAAPGGNFLGVRAACSGFTIVPSLTVPAGDCRKRFFVSPTNWSAFILNLAGTSMAAPHVSGLAALIAGEVGHNPSLITARLMQSADDLGQPGTDPAYGKGRINVARAMGVN